MLLQNSNISSSAALLRPGHACTLDLLGDVTRMQGGINTHMPVTFDDGVQWLVRVRHPSVRTAPKAVSDRTMLSEIETMRAVAKVGGPLIPQVWANDILDERDESKFVLHGSWPCY